MHWYYCCFDVAALLFIILNIAVAVAVAVAVPYSAEEKFIQCFFFSFPILNCLSKFGVQLPKRVENGN